MTASATLEQGAADEEALLHRRAEQEAALLAQRAAEAQDCRSLAEEQAPQLATAEDLENRLTRVTERLRGIAAVAAERLSMLDRVPSPAPGPGSPRRCEQQAEQAQRQQAALSAEAEQHKSAVAAVVAARQAVEAELPQSAAGRAAARTAIDRADAAAGRPRRRDSAAAAAVSARQAELQRAVEARPSRTAGPGRDRGGGAGPDRTEHGSRPPAVRVRQRTEASGQRRQRRSTQPRAPSVGGSSGIRPAETARAETLLASVAAHGRELRHRRAVPEAARGPRVPWRTPSRSRSPHAGRWSPRWARWRTGLVVADPATAAAALHMLRSGGVDRAEFVVALGAEGPASAAPPVGRALSDAVHLGGPGSAAVREILRPFALVADLAEAEELVSIDATLGRR